MLVALASISVLLAGTAGLLLTAAGAVRSAQFSTTATLLAQQKAEQLLAASRDITGGTGEDFLAVDGSPAPMAAAFFIRRWTITRAWGASSHTVVVAVTALGAGRVAEVEAIFGQGGARWP